MNVKIRNKFIEIKYSVSNGLVIKFNTLIRFAAVYLSYFYYDDNTANY